MAPRQAHVAGSYETRTPPMKFLQWQRSISPSWFTSTSACSSRIVHTPLIFPEGVRDTPTTRAAAVFAFFGVADIPKSCPRCKKGVVLRVRTKTRDGDEYMLRCEEHGKRHFERSLNSHGIVKQIEVGRWMPYLFYVVHLTLQRRLVDVTAELTEAYGNINESTRTRWRRMYQEALRHACEHGGLMEIGGGREIAVFDETTIGTHDNDDEEDLGKLKFSQTRASTKAVNTRVLRKRSDGWSVSKTKRFKKITLPAKTIYKQRVGTSLKYTLSPMPKRKKVTNVYNRGKRGTTKDTRSNSIWLWAAVTVGRGSARYTHGNALKRFTFKILPRKSEAIRNKPRGFEEMSAAISSRIKRGTFLVMDKWLASVKAVKKLGFRHAPAVNHSLGWRDTTTGYHSNDIESENARIKIRFRRIYGKLRITELDMYEYTFSINKGLTITNVMDAFCLMNGGKLKNNLLK